MASLLSLICWAFVFQEFTGSHLGFFLFWSGLIWSGPWFWSGCERREALTPFWTGSGGRSGFRFLHLFMNKLINCLYQEEPPSRTGLILGGVGGPDGGGGAREQTTHLCGLKSTLLPRGGGGRYIMSTCSRSESDEACLFYPLRRARRVGFMAARLLRLFALPLESPRCRWTTEPLDVSAVRVSSVSAATSRWRRLFCSPVRACALNGLVRGEWRSFHAALMIRLPACAADPHVCCIRARF